MPRSKRNLNDIADTDIAIVPGETELAKNNMHTALEHTEQIDDPRLNNMHTAESDVTGNLLLRALENATANIQQEANAMTVTEMGANNIDYSNPDPRRNSIVSSVHISNTQMRLESENAIIKAQVDVIDRKIAELQAERTDLLGAYAMNQAGLNAGEKL